VSSSAFSTGRTAARAVSRHAVFSQRSSLACTASREAAGQPIVGDDAQPRMQRVVAATSRRATASPVQRMVPSEVSTNCSSGATRELLGARIDLAGQRLQRRRLQRLGVGAGLRGVGREAEAVEPADMLALDEDIAGLVISVFSIAVLPQAAHQYTGTPINETLVSRSCSASDSLSSTSRA
jgi:hypothetical protein